MCVKENKLELSVKYIGSYGKIIYPFPHDLYEECLSGGIKQQLAITQMNI